MAFFDFFKKNNKSLDEDINILENNDREIDEKIENKEFEIQEKINNVSKETLEENIDIVQEEQILDFIEKDYLIEEDEFNKAIKDVENLDSNEGTEVKNEIITNNEPLEAIKESFFSKIKSGLEKTRNNIIGCVDRVLSGFSSIDDDLYEELEEALIMADIGVETSMSIIEKLKQNVKKERISDVLEVKNLIIKIISDILEENNTELKFEKQSIILVIGVNGVGKTTTIGKLANYYKNENKSVMLAAADTFRAAAIDQLEVWGNRNNVSVIKHQENSDPGAVIFDAVQSQKSKGVDILICDTAGRLHNKKNLMDELKKFFKIINRENPDANLEVFLVLDSTTGQNALQQAKLFNEVADITGLVLTKLDGTAKGGIIISIKNELNIPVRFIGVGESIEDLRPFNSYEFTKALF